MVGDGELCRSVVRIIAALVEWDGLILHGYVSLRDGVVVPRDFGVVWCLHTWRVEYGYGSERDVLIACNKLV